MATAITRLKSARKILVLGGSRHHQSRVLQQQFVAGVVVVEAVLTCCALLVRTLLLHSAAVAGYEGDRFISPSLPAARTPPFLSPLLSLLRLKIGGSFDVHALNATAAPS